MNYIDAMDFLEETKKYGSQLGLTSIQNLMAELGNIQDKIPLVHIGGTNGKGSVGAMLSQVLTEAGYRVGRFCTPDVFVYEDEFQMNGINIEKGRLAQLFTRVKAACEKLVAQGMAHPTRFEVETAAAFLWFYEENCDMALLEVGMGDRCNQSDQKATGQRTDIHQYGSYPFSWEFTGRDRNCKKRHNQTTGAGSYHAAKAGGNGSH